MGLRVSKSHRFPWYHSLTALEQYDSIIISKIALLQKC